MTIASFILSVSVLLGSSWAQRNQYILEYTRAPTTRLILNQNLYTTTPSRTTLDYWASRVQSGQNGDATESPYGYHYQVTNSYGASGQAGAGVGDSRYSYGQSADRYGSRYDSQQQSGRYDNRYNQYGRTEAPYWQQQQQQTRPIDYSQYPPTPKSIVLSESSIYVFWSDPGNAKKRDGGQAPQTTYKVKYSKLQQQSGADAENTLEAVGRDFTLKDLEPGTDYTISVQADRGGQVTGWSAPIRNRTLEQLPLGPPSNIAIEPRDRDATVTLSPPEGLKGPINNYVFLYAPSGGAGRERRWSELQIRGGYPGYPSTAVIPNLVPNEEYFYTVQAVNGRGAGPFSDIRSFRTLSYAAPSSGQAAQPGYGSDLYAGGYMRTTADYYGRYATTESPEYRTPEYILPSQYDPYRTEQPSYGVETTVDYWAGRLGAGGQWGGEQQTAAPQGGDESYWSPSWSASTMRPASGEEQQTGPYGQDNTEGQPGYPVAAEGEGPEPPTIVSIESLEDPTEAVVVFTPAASAPLRTTYEVHYTDDPSAAESAWNMVTVPEGESQAIMDRLPVEKYVLVRLRAKGQNGQVGAFGESKYHFTRFVGQSSSGQQEGQQGGSEQDSQSASGTDLRVGGSASSSGSSHSQSHDQMDGQDVMGPNEDGDAEGQDYEVDGDLTTSAV